MSTAVITISELKADLIKTALSLLHYMPAVQQRALQEEVNRRAINLMCEGLVHGEEPYVIDPLYYRSIMLMNGVCHVHDIRGGQWLLIGI